MNTCPHREPCQECRESERRTERLFAKIAAILAPFPAVVAVALAMELDPRAYAWTGFAIGCVLMWRVSSAEAAQ